MVFFISAWSSVDFGSTCPFFLPAAQSCQIKEKACQTAIKKDPTGMAEAAKHPFRCTLFGNNDFQLQTSPLGRDFNLEAGAGFVNGVGQSMLDLFTKPEIAAGKAIGKFINSATPLTVNCYRDLRCRKYLPQIYVQAISQSLAEISPQHLGEKWAAELERVVGRKISELNNKKSRDAQIEFLRNAPQMAMHWVEEKNKNYDCLDSFTRGYKAGEILAAFAGGGKAATGIAKPFIEDSVRAATKNEARLATAASSGLRSGEIVNNTTAAQVAGLRKKMVVTVPARRSRITDLPSDARDPSRELFVRSEANLIVTTSEENKAFIKEALDSNPRDNRLFVGTEAAELKKMNDLLQDKRFSDAVVNRYKRTVLKTLSKTHDLEAQYPDLKVFASYSDYKGLQILLKGKIPPEIGGKLNEIYESSNAEFVTYLKDNHLLRQGDDTSTWFRMAYGDTFDTQALASRMSRKIEGPPHAASFSDPKLLEFANQRLEQTHALQKTIVSDANLKNLVDSSENGSALKAKVYDLAKKAKTADRLAPLLEKRYGKPVSTEQAQNIINYLKSVDDFPAPLLIEKREIVNLEKAPHGGFTIDLLGVGSTNMKSTAEAVSKSKNIQEAAINSRAAEREATAAIQAKLGRIREIAGPIAKTSGDDSAGAFAKAWTPKQKQELLNQMSADPLAHDIRMAFIPAGVEKVADRTAIATHGEKIEALLRLNLEERGIISPRELDQMTFAIDMNAKRSGVGTATLMISDNGKIADLATQAKVRRALADAVEQNNEILRSEGIVANYRAGR